MVARRFALGALCAAGVALATAAVAAVGPAKSESARYSWPPASLPAERPARGWYAPLPLLNRVPAELRLRVPCGLSPSLADDREPTVLATARRPAETDGLRVFLAGASIRMDVGGDQVARLPWPAACPLRIEVRDGRLTAAGRSVPLEVDTIERMPIVTGLFTDLDLERGQPPHVDVATRPYARSQTTRQAIAALGAVLFACAGLLLVTFGSSRDRSRRPVHEVLASWWRARDRTDAVVVGVLVSWWIIAPTLYDDGWIWAEHQAFDDLGAMGFYYDVWGVQIPLGFWIEWMRNWVLGATSDLVFLRLPGLFFLLAAWFVCRWCVARFQLDGGQQRSRWVLAAAFLVGALAWGMTLRLEPLVCMMVLIAFAAALSFAEEPRFGPLALAVTMAALAGTIHPVGLVSAAPLLAVAPTVVRWARRRGTGTVVALVTLLGCGAALALVAFTLDSDLSARLADARIARTNDPFSAPWWREYVRYQLFEENGGGTAIRRLSLAIVIVAGVGWATRWRSRREQLSLVPGATLAIGLLLLAFVPSKWPWHFGALLGVAAVAFSTECAQFVRDAAERRNRSVAFLVLAVGTVFWAWGGAEPWSPLDLQRLHWGYVFGFGGYAWWAVGLVVAALGTIALILLRRGGRVTLTSRRGPPLAVGVLLGTACATVGVTFLFLVGDAAQASWSPVAQNVQVLSGRSTCGLGGRLADPGDRLGPLRGVREPVLVEPPIALLFPCASIPRLQAGVVETPRLVVVQSDYWLLLERDAPFAALVDLYRLKRISRYASIQVVAVNDRIDGYSRAPVTRTG